MKQYHKYVFDEKARKFVGNFDGLYNNEDVENFDSWHQSDKRDLSRAIALELLDRYNFGSCLDLGCGKGHMTHLLKKNNNIVVGCDISQKACDKARAMYPDVDFHQADIDNFDYLFAQLKEIYGLDYFDLVLCCETLSYLRKYREVIAALSKRSKYVLASLYLPSNPIGFVGSFDDLEEGLGEHFDLIEVVYLSKRRQAVYFGRSKEFLDARI